MRTILTVFAALLLFACSTETPDGDPLELAGDDGKADGIAGKIVVPIIARRLPINYGPESTGQDASLSDASGISSVEPTWRVSGDLIYINTMDTVTVNIDVGHFAFHGSRFLLFRTHPGRLEVERIDCMGEAAHANYFSGVTIDRERFTLVTRAGTRFSFDECGLEAGDNLALFTFPTDGVVGTFGVSKLTAHCAHANCWN